MTGSRTVVTEMDGGDRFGIDFESKDGRIAGVGLRVTECQGERERGVKNDAHVFGLSTRKNRNSW